MKLKDGKEVWVENWKGEGARRDLLMNKAQDRLRTDLDVVKLMKSGQFIDEMLEVLFSNQDRRLLALQKR